MERTFNSPWVGALAADLTQPGAAAAPPVLRPGLAGPAPLPMPGDRYDEIEPAFPARDEESDTEAWAARDRTIYQIGFKLLMAIAAAVGLSMAMVLRS